MSKTVLVTGASGFIALHVVDALLSRNYRVIGTVRSQSKGEKLVRQFNEKYPTGQISYAVVPDIGAKGAFDELLKNHPEITEVLHTASPFSFGLNKPLDEAYLIPATEGTRNVLQAVKDYAPQVKHVVITSSYAAIRNPDKTADKSFVHTEDTWSPVTRADVKDEGSAYGASKKLAEKLAWEFIRDEQPSFTLTTVNPPYVLGPQVFDDVLVNKTLNTSAELVHQWLSLPADDTEYHDHHLGIAVDVRDVALLHVLPIENDGLAGKRLLPVNSVLNAQVLINLIHQEFPELDGKIGKGSPDGAQERADNENEAYDASRTLEWTGVKKWIPIEKTVRDSVQQVLDYEKRKN